MDQYLNRRTLLQLVNVSDTSDFKAVSKDSYSDHAVFETIKNVRGQEHLFFAALQTAIVGFGKKSFGEFKLGEETFDVEKLYYEYGVKSDLHQNAKLQPGDLTPRRLQRFYRYQINKYLEENDAVLPYLWKKYSSSDLRYRTITFPGAESMVESLEEANYLLATYTELDTRLGTNISERIRRVILARGIVTLL
jgi:hypothetical protein